jgi:hypothetical protein
MLEMKRVLIMVVSFYFHLGAKSGDYHDDMNWNNFEFCSVIQVKILKEKF